VEPHPHAERLTVCQVDDGTGGRHAVVCGAPNARTGLRAPFARPGAELPDGNRIERTAVHGVESAGMLCSAKELGISEDAAGLLELAEDATAGEDLRVHARLDERIIEIDLTPNRGDCLSIRGLAREVAAVHGLSIQGPACAPVPARRQDAFPVWLEAPAACPRYGGRVIRGVDPTAPTPEWLAERLRRSGVRPVSALVDVTNYVMLELGQPMHAFDLGRLSESIAVRWSTPGERITLLDERTVETDGETLVIADASGPIALAGIMGGASTAVGDATRDVFLESACFLPHAVAGRARRYGVHTDSSHRFERGVDPQLPTVALERATELVLRICGGEPGPAHDTVEVDRLPRRERIHLRRQRLERMLGHALEPSRVTRFRERLGLHVEVSADGWRALPPSWRYDLALEADLVEEVARLYGYNRAPRTHPAHTARIETQPETRQTTDRLREVLVERDYHEAVTYSFVDSTLQSRLDPETTALGLANPISSDMDVMRTQLWPGLLTTLAHNRNRQQGRVRLFELGRRFRPDGNGGLAQEDVIAGVVDGPAWPEQWDGGTRNADFFDVKGDVEALLATAGRGRFRFVAGEHPALHPGQTARVCDEEGGDCGWLGTLDPRLLRGLDLDRAPILFELALAPLLRTPLPNYAPLSRFPAIRRDLAVIVDESIPAETVLESVREVAPPELREVFAFDVYRGTGIDSGRKSLALGLILQGLSRTLTDDEVESAVGRALDHLKATHGATLRE
jgi:phenylalanyl-tRNA synthetase beta chain